MSEAELILPLCPVPSFTALQQSRPKSGAGTGISSLGSRRQGRRGRWHCISMLAVQAFTQLWRPPPSLTNCVSSSQACSCLQRTSENYFTPRNVCFTTDKARGSRQGSNHSCPQVTYLSLPYGLKYVTTQSTQSRFILVPTLVQTLFREVIL